MRLGLTLSEICSTTCLGLTLSPMASRFWASWPRVSSISRRISSGFLLMIPPLPGATGEGILRHLHVGLQRLDGLFGHGADRGDLLLPGGGEDGGDDAERHTD